MASQYFAILTDYGTRAIAHALSQGQPLQLTQFAVGDGNGQTVTPTASATALVHQTHIAPVSAVSLDPRNNKQVIVELTIPENIGGFYIREMGVFDSQNKLIAYANCPESFKPTESSGSGKVQVLRMILKVESSSAVTLSIDNSVIFVTKQQITPKTITATTQNGFDESGHCHEIAKASTSQQGITQLYSGYESESEDMAATPKSIKLLKAFIDALTRNLSNYIPNSKKSSAVNSNSEDTVANSKAAKIAYDKGVEAKTAADNAQRTADNAQRTADSKQSPATTLAGYGINNFKVENGSGNMNNYRTDGIYCFGTIYGVSNSPRDTNSDVWSGNLQVITGGIGNERWCRQIFHVHYSKDTYIRWQVSNTNDDWSAWEKLNDIEPVIRSLGTKANISHTHTANQITDFNTAVRNLFSGVSAENGWCKLPNGLILQWGKITLPNLTNEQTGVCTLPVTFPHAVFTIIMGSVAGATSHGPGAQEGFSIKMQTTSNFTWVSSWESRNNGAFGNAPAQWIAIGY